MPACNIKEGKHYNVKLQRAVRRCYLWPLVSAQSAFYKCFASFRLWLTCIASSFPRERKGNCCAGPNTYVRFSLQDAGVLRLLMQSTVS